MPRFLSFFGLSFGSYILLDEVVDQVDQLTANAENKTSDPSGRGNTF